MIDVFGWVVVLVMLVCALWACCGLVGGVVAMCLLLFLCWRVGGVGLWVCSLGVMVVYAVLVDFR